jgi:D-beta-D-heptose 7-phosphate kinase/D-beta-D-heptose 1-phosphate adenosyltransferase
MILKRLDEILAQTARKRIVVIGDLMLDEFVWGKVSRISPEAPVPVVQVTGESFFPGGAANVARNLRDFVDRTAVIGVVGQDRGGRQLRTLLDEQNIDTAAVVEDPSLQTIVKTRVIAGHQQVVRVDREQVRSPTAEQVTEITRSFNKIVADTDAVIFEDYGKGFLDSELVRQISARAQGAGKIVAADPNPNHPLDWRNTTVVKPNRAEAFLAAGLPCTDSTDHPEKDAALLRVGAILLEKWDTKSLLVTLGEQGMILFHKNETPHHIPTKAQQVFDVSGAGDTAIALFTLALCCGASPIEAAEIATHASAVVVGKLGTATVTKQELRASFQNDESAA